jgi:hypothetical protein
MRTGTAASPPPDELAHALSANPIDSSVAREAGLSNSMDVTGTSVVTRHDIVGAIDNTIHMLAFLTT